MTFLVLLFTGSAIFAGIALVSCVIARRHCQEANHSAARLQQARGTIAALEGIVAVHDGQLRAVNGRVSALKRWGVDAPPPEHTPVANGDTATCPNWRTPSMPEGDDCDFCTRMRAERAHALATMKPPVLRSAR